MVNKQQAMLNPASIFKSPKQVVTEPSLTREEKIRILHQWAYDINELVVAEEENMPATNDGQHAVWLQEIHLALEQLGDHYDESKGGVTKHGTP